MCCCGVTACHGVWRFRSIFDVTQWTKHILFEYMFIKLLAVTEKSIGLHTSSFFSATVPTSPFQTHVPRCHTSGIKNCPHSILSQVWSLQSVDLDHKSTQKDFWRRDWVEFSFSGRSWRHTVHGDQPAGDWRQLCVVIALLGSPPQTETRLDT